MVSSVVEKLSDHDDKTLIVVNVQSAVGRPWLQVHFRHLVPVKSVVFAVRAQNAFSGSPPFAVRLRVRGKPAPMPSDRVVVQVKGSDFPPETQSSDGRVYARITLDEAELVDVVAIRTTDGSVFFGVSSLAVYGAVGFTCLHGLKELRPLDRVIISPPERGLYFRG